MHQHTHHAPIAPRRTEHVARETLGGLIIQALELRGSDHPQAWDRIAEIGREIQQVAETTAREFRRRRQAVAIEVCIVEVQL